MSEYFLFASPDSVERIQSPDYAPDGSLVIAVRGNRASYVHNGVQYALDIHPDSSYEMIAQAVDAHIGGRHEERAAGFRGHGPVDHSRSDTYTHETESSSCGSQSNDDLQFQRLQQFCGDEVRECINRERTELYSINDGVRAELKCVQDQVQGLCAENKQLKSYVNTILLALQQMNGLTVVAPVNETS